MQLTKWMHLEIEGLGKLGGFAALRQRAAVQPSEDQEPKHWVWGEEGGEISLSAGRSLELGCVWEGGVCP